MTLNRIRRLKLFADSRITKINYCGSLYQCVTIFTIFKVYFFKLYY